MNKKQEINTYIYILMILLTFSMTVSRALRNLSFYLIVITLIFDLVKTKQLLTLIKESKILKASLVFMLTIVINVIVHNKFESIDKLYIKAGLKIFATLMMFSFYKMNSQKQSVLVKSFLIGACLNLFYSIYQSEVKHLHRTSGFLDVNQLMGLLNYLFIGLFVFILYRKKILNKSYKIFSGVLLLLTGVGIIYNKSRGGWLALILTLAFCFLIKNKKHFFIYIFILIFSGFTLLKLAPSSVYINRFKSITNTKTDGSNLIRLNFWKGGVKIYKDYPIFGVGYGKFKENFLKEKYFVGEQKAPHILNTHNNIIQLISEAGTVGLLGFLYFMFTLFFELYKRYKETDENYATVLLLSGMGIILVYNLHGMTENNIISSKLIYFFWVIIGFILNATNKNTDLIEEK